MSGYAAIFKSCKRYKSSRPTSFPPDGGLTIQLQDSLAGEMAKAIMRGEIDVSGWMESDSDRVSAMRADRAESEEGS